MDQPVEYDPQSVAPESIDGEVMTDGELVGQEGFFQETAFQKYWRENRLLNSMLMALLLLLILFGVLWNLIIYQRIGIDAGTDFTDAGQQISQQKQKKQQEVRLKQWQKKANPPPSSSSFRAKAVSDPFWTRSGSGTDPGPTRDGPGLNPSGFLERVLNRSEAVLQLRPTTDEGTHVNCFP